MIYSDPRIRFDDSHIELLDSIRKTGYFKDLASVALFCGALGFRNKVKKTTRGNNRDVRYSALATSFGAIELIDAIFLLENYETDPWCLSAERLADRVKLFEQYCAGGLEALMHISSQGKSMEVAIPELINKAWGNND